MAHHALDLDHDLFLRYDAGRIVILDHDRGTVALGGGLDPVAIEMDILGIFIVFLRTKGRKCHKYASDPT